MSPEKQHGGGGNGGWSGGFQPFFTMYSSKAEQILSRYRPIAPKPPAPKPGEGADSPAAAVTTAPQSSSSVSIGYNRRGRKRSSQETVPSPRKRGGAAAAAKQQAAAGGGNGGPGTGLSVVPVVVEMGGNVMVAATAAVVPAVSTASSSTLTMVRSSSSCDQQPQQVVSTLPAVNRGGTVWKMVMPASNVSSSPTSPWCDRFRFGRPAGTANVAPHHLLEESSPNSYEQQWKSFDQKHFLPQQQQQQGRHVTTNHHHCVDAVTMNHHHQSDAAAFRQQQQVTMNHHQQLPQANSEMGSAESGLDAMDEQPKLVTLSLLPDTPSHPRAESSASTSALGLRFRSDANEEDQAAQEQQQMDASPLPPLKLSLFSGGGGDDDQHQHQHHHHQQQPVRQQSQTHHQHDQIASTMDRGLPLNLIDVNYLEQAYGSSSDPVMLTSDDGSNRLLWSNLAYNKAISERIQRNQGPYIDPLGLPTQLGAFTFRSSWPGECSSAVLWGFLKKFMLRDNNGGTSVDHGTTTGSSTRPSVVIAPQPVRTAGARTSVSLESVSEANTYSGYLVGSLDSVEAQLERTSSPAFVTDRSNRVRWVNSAFGQLVGCAASSSRDSNSTSGVGSGGGSGGGGVGGGAGMASSSMNQQQVEDVSFSWHTSKSPYSAVSLVGQVRLDWLDSPTPDASAGCDNNFGGSGSGSSGGSGGRRRCLASVPCEMRRLDEEHFGSSAFFWKLSLNVGSGNRNHHQQQLQKMHFVMNTNINNNVVMGGHHSHNISNSESSDSGVPPKSLSTTPLEASGG